MTFALASACGGSTENAMTFDSEGPSVALDPSPAFSDVGPTSATTPTGEQEATASTPTSAGTTTTAPTAATTPALPAATTTTIATPTTAEPDTAPPVTFLPEAEPVAAFDLPGCPDTPRAAVGDKEAQRYWLCADGVAITDGIPMTTASGNYGLPPVGTYPVFARDFAAFGIGGEPLERFVAFYTTPRGNRIAFHEVVNQDPGTVGDLDQRGASAGCFRVREDDSIKVWDFLQIDDPVVIIT